MNDQINNSELIKVYNLLPPPKLDMQDYTIETKDYFYHFRAMLVNYNSATANQRLRWKFLDKTAKEKT